MWDYSLSAEERNIGTLSPHFVELSSGSPITRTLPASVRPKTMYNYFWRTQEVVLPVYVLGLTVTFHQGLVYQCYAGGTRTCIHTPGEPMKANELDSKHAEILEQASLLYFDGRLTEAAIGLAKKGRDAGKHSNTLIVQDQQHTRLLCPICDFEANCWEQFLRRKRGLLIASKCHWYLCILMICPRTY